MELGLTVNDCAAADLAAGIVTRQRTNKLRKLTNVDRERILAVNTPRAAPESDRNFAAT
jgi:hypothetical protein